MKLDRNKIFSFMLAAVFALALAGCGGGGGTAAVEEEVMKTPEEIAAEMEAAARATCEGAGGRYNADSTCTTAEELVQERIDAAVQAEKDRVAAEEAEQERIAAEKAMAATAAKLYAGISAPMGDPASPAATDRAAAYNADDSAILVSIGDGTNTPTAVTLSENKDATVADNHGWEGKMYADPAGGDSIEAVVYSNVGEPTMGKKFGGAAANDEFEYALTNGTITVDTSTAGVPARVALPGVTRTAGTETFKLPSPNPQGATMINVPGSFHGVSGTYSCTPSTPADGCTASVAAKGFTLGAGAWTFRPSDPNARVTDSPDASYVSYGFWIRKAANNGPFTASAFVDVKGTVEAASGIDALNGTATYMGGAAGKYALASSTGGTNDAGHFTARATLNANFTNNTGATAITGTIDMFMGADDMPRDWSVKLNGSPITDAGLIGEEGDTTAGNAMTEWTIGGTAAADAGTWTGALRNNGSDGVPQVGTGTFYSTYGTAGKMVGAFGVNKQ